MEDKLRQIQISQLEILKEVIRICEKKLIIGLHMEHFGEL